MLAIEYKRLDQCHLFTGNSKQHDIGLIARLANKHGFRVPPIWDNTVQAIVAGNGRIETLTRLMNAGESPPKGIEVDPVDGMWLVPVVVGLDSNSQEEATAFLIDENNSVIMGGEFTALDATRVWDMDGYLSLLTGALNFVETVDTEDFRLIQQVATFNAEDALFEEPQEPTSEPKYSFKFTFTDEAEFDEVHRFFQDNKFMGKREDLLLHLVRSSQ